MDIAQEIERNLRFSETLASTAETDWLERLRYRTRQTITVSELLLYQYLVGNVDVGNVGPGYYCPESLIDAGLVEVEISNCGGKATGWHSLKLTKLGVELLGADCREVPMAYRFCWDIAGPFRCECGCTDVNFERYDDDGPSGLCGSCYEIQHGREAT